MTHHMRTRIPRSSIPHRLAVLLALVTLIAFSPGLVPSVRAADDDLRLEADATYRIDVDDALVRVRIDIRATNRKPNTVRNTSTGTVTTRYYFDRLFLALQEGATSVRATSGGSRLRTSIDDKKRYRELEIVMPPLYYGRTRSIRVEFVIPGGKPRSSSDTRVGSAYTTFTSWAWGDTGRSTVRIVLPAGFKDSGYGTGMTTGTDADGRLVMTAGTISDPLEWYHVVSADRESKLTDVRLGSADEPVVIRAWPEDEAWRDEVAEVLEAGIPALQERIGLDWPVDGPLEVTEVHTPLLEGYAGFYDPDDDTIRMSEDLDVGTILHEASHAWFNHETFADRWINEGLAEVYAELVRQDIGKDDDTPPETTTRTSSAAFPLALWPRPGRIDDEDAQAQESYGYAASYTVMAKIVNEVGDAAMAEVFRAIEDQHIAYVGDAPAETVGPLIGWRRFLDLVEEIGATDGLAEEFEAWVAPDGSDKTFEERADARTTYAALAAAGDAWAVPFGARSAMGQWRFPEAVAIMEAATAAIDRRDALADLATELDVAVPGDQEEVFESARRVADLEVVGSTLDARIGAAETVADARDALAAERPPLVALGLLGEEPAVGYAAARVALSEGDVDGAIAGAQSSMAVLAAADEVGMTRAAIAAGIAIGLLLLLVAVLLIRRRRRRRSVAALAVEPGGYGTLGNPNEAIDEAREPSTATDGPAPQPPTGVQTD